MRALGVIIARNAEATGREAAHAFNDGDLKTFHEIEAAREDHDENIDEQDEFLAFEHGAHRGREEG